MAAESGGIDGHLDDRPTARFEEFLDVRVLQQVEMVIRQAQTDATVVERLMFNAG